MTAGGKFGGSGGCCGSRYVRLVSGGKRCSATLRGGRSRGQRPRDAREQCEGRAARVHGLRRHSVSVCLIVRSSGRYWGYRAMIAGASLGSLGGGSLLL